MSRSNRRRFSTANLTLAAVSAVGISGVAAEAANGRYIAQSKTFAHDRCLKPRSEYRNSADKFVSSHMSRITVADYASGPCGTSGATGLGAVCAQVYEYLHGVFEPTSPLWCPTPAETDSIAVLSRAASIGGDLNGLGFSGAIRNDGTYDTKDHKYTGYATWWHS
jgi:hypothetical protein